MSAPEIGDICDLKSILVQRNSCDLNTELVQDSSDLNTTPDLSGIQMIKICPVGEWSVNQAMIQLL